MEELIRQLDNKLDALILTVSEIKTNQTRDARDIAEVRSTTKQHEELVQRGKGVFWGMQLLWTIVAAWLHSRIGK